MMDSSHLTPDDLPLAERARLAETVGRLDREVRDLQLLHSIGRSLAAVPDLDTLLSRIVEAGVQVTGAEDGYLLLVDGEMGELRLRAEQNLGDERAKLLCVRAEDSLAGQAVRSGEPVVVSRQRGSAKVASGYLANSVLCVPLKANDEVSGVLGVANRVSDASFSGDDVQLLRMLADYAAIAVANAQRLDVARRLAEQSSALSDVIMELGKEMDQRSLLEKIVQKAVALLSAAGGAAYLLERTSNHRKLVAEVGLSLNLAGQAIRNDEGIGGEVLRTGKPMAVPVYHCWDKRLRSLDPLRLTAVAGAPIRVAGRSLGVLVVHHTDPERRFDQAVLALLGQFADHAGLALLKTKLLDGLRKMLDVSTVITSSLHLSEVLSRTCQAAVELFEADHSGMMLLDEGGEWGTVKGEYPPHPRTLGTRIPIKGVPAEERLVAGRETLVYPDVEEAAEELGPVLEMWKHFGIRSVLIAPVVCRGDVVGSFSVDGVGRTLPFTEEDVELCRVFAAYAAVAVENLQLMLASRTRARRLEQLAEATSEMLTRGHSFNLDEVMELAAKYGCEILDAEATTVFLKRKPGILTKQASHGHRDGGFHKGKEFPIVSKLGSGLIGHIASAGKVFRAHGDELTRHWATTGKPPDHVASGRCCSLLAVPLTRRIDGTEQLVGLLEAENKKDADGHPRPYIGFTRDDESLLIALGNTLTVCLENAELHGKTSASLAEKVSSLQAIQDISIAVSAKLDLNELQETVVVKVASVLSARAVGLMTWDDRQRNLVPSAKRGLSDEYYQLCVGGEQSSDIFDQTTRRFPLLLYDPSTAPFGANLIAAEGLHFGLTAPLVASDRLVGLLNIYRKREDGHFTNDEKELAELLARHVAVALQNTQLHQQARQHTEVLNALWHAGQTITRSLKLESILEELLVQARRVTGKVGQEPHFGAMLLVEGGRLGLASAFPEEVRDLLKSTLEAYTDLDEAMRGAAGLVARVVRSGESRLVTDVTDEPDLHSALHRETHALLAVPIKLGDAVFGVIEVEHPEPGAFDMQDRLALEALASQAAIAVDNAHRYEDLQKIQGLVGRATAMEWMTMVSAVWGHAIRRECSVAKACVFKLGEMIGDEPHGRRMAEEIARLNAALKRIVDIPILAPLASEDEVRSVRINELVGAYLDRQWMHARYKPIELVRDLDASLDQLAVVRASPQWLRRSLEHIVENAVDAMLEADSPEKRLVVRTRLLEGEVEISVEDTGPGIPDHLIEGLFRKPVDKPPGSRGAGIGLLVANTIAQTYGGRMYYVGREGDKGPTVVIRLPVEQQRAAG